jgi:putative serine/threonine protein kinase
MWKGLEESLELQKERGKHSEVYLISKYAIKVFRKEFVYNFFKEVKFLTLLQPFDFVPRLYCVDLQNLKLVMERISGERIGNLLRNTVNAKRDTNREELERVIMKCLDICFLLDTFSIQKEEMHRPDKHIIVRGDRVVFIDFERSHFTKKPSNLCQFASYLPLQIGDELKILLARYKKDLIGRQRLFPIIKNEIRKKWIQFEHQQDSSEVPV